ncbi:MAG: hypothetical protein QM608_22555 [Caulobacter sp.]
MCAGLATAVVVLSAMAGCAEQKKAPPLPPLDGLLAFKEPARCLQADDFERLSASVVTFGGTPWDITVLPGVLQVPEAYRSRFGETDVEILGDKYRARVPLSGTWRGLKVREIAVGGWLGLKDRRWIGFDAPYEDVLREANAAGFKLGRAGKRVDGEGPLRVVIAVEKDPSGGALLSCEVG